MGPDQRLRQPTHMLNRVINSIILFNFYIKSIGIYLFKRCYFR